MPTPKPIISHQIFGPITDLAKMVAPNVPTTPAITVAIITRMSVSVVNSVVEKVLGTNKFQLKTSTQR